LDAKTPVKSVSTCRDVDSVDRSVPRVVSTVSWAFRFVSWFFHGVSTACSMERICETVEATSIPVPLLIAPKFNPTVLIYTSMKVCNFKGNCIAKLDGKKMRRLS
jgi:hypothetical protein